MSCTITIRLTNPIVRIPHDRTWRRIDSSVATLRPDPDEANSGGIIQAIQESGIATRIHAETHGNGDETGAYAIHPGPNGEPPYQRLRHAFDSAGWALRGLLPDVPRGFADATMVTLTIAITV